MDSVTCVLDRLCKAYSLLEDDDGPTNRETFERELKSSFKVLDETNEWFIGETLIASERLRMD